MQIGRKRNFYVIKLLDYSSGYSVKVATVIYTII